MIPAKVISPAKPKRAHKIQKPGDSRSGAAEAERTPTYVWPVANPEQQGMDSARLLNMVDFYERKHAKRPQIEVDSITIIRNGFLVADLYFNPYYPRDSEHVIHSCTKSILSTLIGIAIAKGYIESVSTKVIEILGHKIGPEYDERLQRLTIEDLLTMQTGIRSEDSYLYQWRGLFAMQRVQDWTAHILALPFDLEPGKRFDYSNMSSYLLSAIISTATGVDALTFANRHLFAPLGIKAVRWAESPEGVAIGWARMWLLPHDMAKIGWLYLQNGRWAGQQIVPSAWVKSSTTAHSFPKKYRPFMRKAGQVHYPASVLLWLFTNLARPFADGYGYQWWLAKDGLYAASGVGGQYIVVAPQQNLVVVFTSKLSGADSFFPIKLLRQFILPAIVSDGALPPNDAAAAALWSLATPPESRDAAKPMTPLPPIAAAVSGATYKLASNLWQYDDLVLEFLPDQPVAQIAYTTTDGRISYKIGLDDVPRLSQSGRDTYAARGSWTGPKTFTVDYEVVGYSNRGRWRFTFSGDEVAIEESGVTGTQSYGGQRWAAGTGAS